MSQHSERVSVKRVVVANYVPSTLNRFYVGFTVFGNKGSPGEVVPGVKERMDSAVRAVAESRFDDVVFLNNPPEPPAPRLYWADLSEVYASFAKTLASQYKADAVMLVLPRKGFPYGVPREMMTSGLGVYHSGDTARIEPLINVLVLKGSTGRRYGFGLALQPSPVVSVLWKPSFKDYTEQEKRLVIDAAISGFKGRVERTTDMQGFRP